MLTEIVEKTIEARTIATGVEVLKAEASAVVQLADSLSNDFVKAVNIIHLTVGRVIVSGMGKSGHIARKIAATLASTGTPAHFVHPAEASHGDLGMITSNDTCLILSNSGETPELSDLIAHTRRFKIPMIGVAARADSTLMKAADVKLLLPAAGEACKIGMVPTTSTTVTLALGDALAVAVMERRDFSKENFRTFHPGGKLGAQLLKVSALMHSDDELPLVTSDTPMTETIITMTAKTFGVAGLIDVNGRLIGIITDGDLRRNISELANRTAGEVASRNPRHVPAEMLAAEALGLMNEHKINCLFVTSADQKPIGLLRIHDCLRAGVA